MAEQIQFEFAHGAFQAQEQSVVDEAGIVDAIRIDDDGAHHAAQLDEMVPIAAVPRQARRFDAEDRAHLARADFRDESLEAGRSIRPDPDRPRSSSMTTTSWKPSSRAWSANRVLASLTFLIVDDLAG